MTAYAKEKFSSAIRAMATSAESIQDRLYYAFTIFIPVREDDFKDPEVRTAFEQIHDKLTSIKEDPREEGLVRVTTRQMSDAEASSLAQEICDFYFVHLTD